MRNAKGARVSRMMRLTRLAVALGALALPAAAHAATPGALDTNFNGTGFVTTPSGTQLLAVAVGTAGNYIAAGETGGHVFVERFTPSGTADATYTGAAGVARAVAVQPDGRIVVAGASGGAMFVERLTSMLTADSTFGSSGVATAFGGSSGSANAVAVAPDGAIDVAGSVYSPNTHAAVAQFTSTGAPDPAFNGNGSQVYNFDNYSTINGIAVQPNSQVVFVGSQTPSQITNGVIGRLSLNGTLDGSFNGGVFTYHLPGGGYTSLNAVAVENDGKILAAGVGETQVPNALFLRLTSTGGYDSSFGSSGVSALPAAAGQFAGGYPVGGYAIGIAGGGRVVAAGGYERGGADFAPGTYVVGGDASGTPGAPDGAWGANGTQTGPIDSAEACGLTIAPDGSVVIVGQTVGYSDNTPCAVSSGAGGFIARYGGFGPPPAPPATPYGSAPTATTGPASEITATSAGLSGQVDTGKLPTTYFFQYGTSTAYSSQTPTQKLSGSSTTQVVTATLSGLTPGTTYHYRLVASNADGNAGSGDRTFQTPPAPGAPLPSVTTGAARAVTGGSATLTGSVDPHGVAGQYRFQYGRGTRYGSTTTASALGTSATSVSAQLRNLRPGTVYHYRLVATNSAGTSYGADRTFRTGPPLKLGVGKLPTRISAGTVSAHGLSVSYSCSEACSLRGTLSLVLSATTERRLHLHSRQLSLALGSGRLTRAGRGTLRLTLSRSAQQTLRRAGSGTLQLSLQATPTGGPSVGLVRRLVLG